MCSVVDVGTGVLLLAEDIPASLCKGAHFMSEAVPWARRVLAEPEGLSAFIPQWREY